MTPCWSEGDLRAGLDRELPSAELDRMNAHLGECRACRDRSEELRARAAFTGALLHSLEVPALVPAVRQVPAIRVIAARPVHRWVPVAVALAAGLALASYIVPKRQTPKLAGTDAPAAAAVQTAAIPLVQAAAPTPHLATPRRPHRAAAKPAEFIALDDEPFESGLIVRVDVPDTTVQADVVFSPDGRARAYRLIQASSTNRNRHKERRNE